MLLSFSTDVYVIFCYWNISMKWMDFHLHLSVTDVDIFFVWKISYNFNTALDYLLMLTIFHVQNVLIILVWCLCDFLLLKHIDEVHALHVDLSFTYVVIFLCRKYSTISILVLIIYWCWLFFMCKMLLSFLTDVYVIFCYWNISMKWMDFHLHLWLTDVDIFFCVQNILQFQYCFGLFTDVDYFSCAKCSYHSRLMFMWFSVTEIYRRSACTSCWFVIYWCWHIFCVKNILQFEYCFWLFTAVDYFSCAKFSLRKFP